MAPPGPEGLGFFAYGTEVRVYVKACWRCVILMIVLAMCLSQGWYQ